MFEQFAFLDLGTPELVIILLIVLILFGGKNLPKLSKGLAESVRELRKGLNEDVHDKKSNTKKETASKKDSAA